MGFLNNLFARFKGKKDVGNRFFSEANFREKLAKQKTMSPQILVQLRMYGVTDSSNLKLEFFFYTDKETNSQSLATTLKDLGYEANSQGAAGDSGLFLVTGWTTPISMSDAAVVAWAEKMCRLGFEHDCEFDGWGTNPQQ